MGSGPKGSGQPDRETTWKTYGIEQIGLVLFFPVFTPCLQAAVDVHEQL